MMTLAKSELIHGRCMGKSYVNSLLQNFYASMSEYKSKIKWQRLPGLKLQAYVDDIRPENRPGRGLQETDMDPIGEWTMECNCGTRLSFNVWHFKNEKQITMFLIRWAS